MGQNQLTPAESVDLEVIFDLELQGRILDKAINFSSFMVEGKPDRMELAIKEMRDEVNGFLTASKTMKTKMMRKVDVLEQQLKEFNNGGEE